MDEQYAQRIHKLSTWELIEEMMLMTRVARAQAAEGNRLGAREALDHMGAIEREAQSRQLTIDDVIRDAPL